MKPQPELHPVIYTTATELNHRLDAVFTQPQTIMLMGADQFASAGLLQQRYPQAKITEIDPEQSFLDQSQQIARQRSSFWQKIRQQFPKQKQQNFETSLETDYADMLWSNLALHSTDKIQDALTNSIKVLKNKGMFFAATFGPDTLQEIAPLLRAEHIPFNREKLWDMHDLGDMLVHAGYTDPVTDMSRLTLTYTQAETFWLDMAQLRLWQAFTIDTPVENYQKIISYAIEQGQLPQITLEIVYAHAVKIKSSITNEKPIYFYPKNTC